MSSIMGFEDEVAIIASASPGGCRGQASRMKGISFAVFPIPDHAFFEQSQFEGLLGDNFLEVCA